MATEAASAEKQARAQATLNSHVERIAKSIGVAAPPPARADNKAAQNAAETERLSAFLEVVANHVDPNRVTKMQLPQDLGGVGEYNEQEEQRKAQAKGARGAGAGDEPDAGDADDESPVSDSNADEAIASIGHMRSKEKLQAIADNDSRVSVKKAAQDRLAAL